MRVERRAIFEEVEARILFSADFAPGLLDPAAPSDPTLAAQTASVEPGTDTTTTAADTTGATATTTAPDASQVASQMLTMPMAFEQNQGQVDSQVDYVAHGSGYTTYLSNGNAQIDFQQGGSVQSLQLNLVGGQTPTAANGQDLLASTTNYLNDPNKQTVDVANYGAVGYSNVYNGIDLRYYGNQRQLEYDFTVNAGANVNDIRMQFSGAKSVSIGANGDLVLTLDDSGKTISFQAPVTYQDTAAGRQAVTSSYVIHDDGTVGFTVGNYDHSLALVIDPTLTYAGYIGGAGTDGITGVAVDTADNVYVVGSTNSATFTPGGGSNSGSNDMFVAKFNAAGATAAIHDLSRRHWRRPGAAASRSTAVGQAYLVGRTTSTSWGSAFNGGARTSLASTTQDSFLVKLNAAGNSVLYSTYGIEGNDADTYFSVAVDNSGHAYVAGETGTATASNIAVAKYNTTATGAGSLMLSKSIGDSTTINIGYSIAIDASGNAYITGDTHATGLTTAGAYDSTYGTNADAYVVELNTSFTTTYFSYIGGSGADRARSLVLDSTGKVIIGGFIPPRPELRRRELTTPRIQEAAPTPAITTASSSSWT